MIKESRLSKEKLISNWDEYTSPSRFAGSDDMFDDIFISSRKGDRVTLVRKPRAAIDMFSTVFRGKLCSEKNGSSIKGIYTVGIADYIISFIFAVFYGYIVYTVYERSGNVIDLRFSLLVVIGLLLLYLALRPKNSAKKKYNSLFDKISENC